MGSNRSTTPAISVDLHGLTLTFQTSDKDLRERFELVYGHLPRPQAKPSDVLITWQLDGGSSAPLPPAGLPVISEDPLVSYFGTDSLIVIRMPKYGLITVDLSKKCLTGVVTRNCLEGYGVFEDAFMISLAPLYRRQGWFPLHAFAALGPNNKVALITGQMGSGKTTTGLALLSATWKLLSNDSPLLTLRNNQVYVLAYPGQLSAFDDSLARFEHLTRFIPAASTSALSRSEKRLFRAEEAFSEPWVTAGVAGGVFFPQVVAGLKHSELVQISSKAALLQLMPQGIEGWDKHTIAPTLQLLGQLTKQAPCYLLRLSPRVKELPALIASGLE